MATNSSLNVLQKHQRNEQDEVEIVQASGIMQDLVSTAAYNTIWSAVGVDMTAKQRLSIFMKRLRPERVHERCANMRARMAYKGFEPASLLEQVTTIEPDVETLVDDLFFLFYFLFTRGTKFTKIIQTMETESAAKMTTLGQKYGIQDNAGRSKDTVTLSRLAMTFAPFAIMVAADPNIPLVVDCDLGEEGNRIPFPRVCRSSTVLSLIPDNAEAGFRSAITCCVVYHQLRFGQVIKKRKRIRTYKQAYKANANFLSAIKPTIFELSNADKMSLLNSVGLDPADYGTKLRPFVTKLTEDIKNNVAININPMFDLDFADAGVEEDEDA